MSAAALTGAYSQLGVGLFTSALAPDSLATIAADPQVRDISLSDLRHVKSVDTQSSTYTCPRRCPRRLLDLHIVTPKKDQVVIIMIKLPVPLES
jgi:hypothetical protein